jgi:hypothetical protein
MAVQLPFSQPTAGAPCPPRKARVEYVGFRDVDSHREFQFRVYGTDGSSEFRLRIASEAFDTRRISMQDCPDLCYQALLKAIAAELPAPPEVITLADADLVRYREEHTPVPRRRARPPEVERPPAVAARKPVQYRTHPRKAAAPEPVAVIPVEVVPPFAEGQRVNHAVFGLGVTTTTTSDRTTVSFDEGAARSFVTSMLQVEVLSAPGTWEVGRRGNRPCASPSADSGSVN